MVQTTLQPPGGGNAVTAWMLEALKHDYDITVLSWMPMDLDAVNRYYGTALRQSDFKIKTFPGFFQRLINAIPGDPWNYQGYCMTMRWCKMIKHRFDILMTSCNETDFGARGIQYIHYPYHREKYLDESRCVKRDGFLPFLHRNLRHRLRPWRIISGFSFKRMKRNLTLVNSRWTRRVFQEVYGVDSRVVYPPVPGDFPEVPWTEKENGFVCIGRISNEKRYESLIDILTAVRIHFPEIHLHIIGSPVDYDMETYQRLKTKVSENSSWVFLHECVSRDELTKIVSRHRYGIHGMKEEHFGIAVAEMVHGGCIPYVPDSGGQIEIVGDERRLLFGSGHNAVKKILHMLDDREMQEELGQYIHSRKNLFSTVTFIQKIQDIVREFSAGDQ